MALPQRIARYQVLRTIGSGGMGAVFEVQDPTTPRSLALKLIRAGMVGETAQARFWREAELLAKVRHKNVVRIHELGQAPAGPYMVMELVQGPSLKQACREGLPAEQTAGIVHDLAGALAALHEQGILHRDLKPDNVILREGAIPVLLDFGLARDADANTLTEEGNPLGTPAYMSPEQAEGLPHDQLDVRTDVYGLGVILYDLLAGAPPFEAGSWISLINMVLSKEPERPSARREGVDPELEAICLKAMAKQREARYPDALAFREDLARFIAGEPTEAGTAAGVARRGRRTVAFLGIAVVGLAGALFGLVQATRADPPPDRKTVKTVKTKPAAPPEKPPAPLWTLAVGDRFRFTSMLREKTDGERLQFSVHAAAKVVGRVGERLKLEFRFTGVRVAYVMGGAAASYDTRSGKGHRMLRGLNVAVGRLATVTCDPLSGAITEMRGMDAIGQAVNARSKKVSEFQNLGGLYETAFSDAFVGRATETLNNVRRGKRRPLPWRAGGKPGEFVLAEAEHSPGMPLLLAKKWRLSPSDLFRLDGKVTFKAGRLVFGWAEQKLVSEDGRRSTTRWSMRVHPPKK